MGSSKMSAAAVLAAVLLAQPAAAAPPSPEGLNARELAWARKAVDPHGELADLQRNLAALGSVYQYWANKGDPERAQAMAGQMLRYYRLVSLRYAAIVAHAKQPEGGASTAALAALKAYVRVPDGRDARLTFEGGRVVYRCVAPDGRTVAKSLATPQEMAAGAMGLATEGFDEALVAAAGGPGAASRRPVVVRPVFRLPSPPMDAVAVPEDSAPVKTAPPAVDCLTTGETFGGGAVTHCAPE